MVLILRYTLLWYVYLHMVVSKTVASWHEYRILMREYILYNSFMFSFKVGCSCSKSSPSKSASGAVVILFASICVTHLEHCIPSLCLCYGRKTLLTAGFLTNNLQPSEKIVNESIKLFTTPDIFPLPEKYDLFLWYPLCTPWSPSNR